MKVTELGEPHGLRVMCNPEEQYRAIKALINRAEKEGICPNAISVVRVDECFDIVLWGDK